MKKFQNFADFLKEGLYNNLRKGVETEEKPTNPELEKKLKEERDDNNNICPRCGKEFDKQNDGCNCQKNDFRSTININRK